MPKSLRRPPKRRLKKIPLTAKEKERLAEDFIAGAARSTIKEEKEKQKAIFLRIPKWLYDDLKRIEKLTRHKRNAFILQSIMDATREKLKQIECAS